MAVVVVAVVVGVMLLLYCVHISNKGWKLVGTYFAVFGLELCMRVTLSPLNVKSKIMCDKKKYSVRITHTLHTNTHARSKCMFARTLTKRKPTMMILNIAVIHTGM